jgi:2-polyprenyl-3-methyl-5-hydroxy-6-metoxy-1,4-benzoquinol methylase
MKPPRDEAQVWDDWNSTYADGELDEPSERRMREILGALSDRRAAGAKILEVGCGMGRLSSKLREFGKVTAVDLGVKIIETAQARYPDIDFRSGNVHTLDCPSIPST